MNAAVEKLRKVSGPVLSQSEPRSELLKAGDRERELHSLLFGKNGFLCFESALHVFPSGGGEISLEAWNARALWRGAYDDMANGILFFAQDVFGNQFGIAGREIISFDAETGEVEVIANSIQKWAEAVLADFEYMTGYPLAHSWQKKNGGLLTHERLVAKQPFVLGGEFDVENLYAMDATNSMRFRGELALQIRDLPDGTSIELKVVP